MKLFKLIIILLLIISLPVGFYFLNKKNNSFNPISSQNGFYQKLNLAIKTSQINISPIKIRDFNNEVEFYLIENNYQTKIILSTQKDPVWQISSLQELLKTAKINKEDLKLVDLSSTHPYATFKNN
ncbi:MAG: hypothetical protein WC895_00270 [Candidatus Shapirobacteria bacterium]|jgi:predicted ATP-grasp superfamily ATP-dependent carboligase